MAAEAQALQRARHLFMLEQETCDACGGEGLMAAPPPAIGHPAPTHQGKPLLIPCIRCYRWKVASECCSALLRT